MKTYPYVIIGGGMTADAAIGGIRRHDHQGEVLVVSEELYPPYSRPPLTKGLWKQERMEQIWLPQWDKEASRVDLLLGARIVELDRKSHRCVDQYGREYGYEKLLLATGGKPRRLPGDPKGVFYPRTLAEHIALYQRVQEDQKVLVIGGGFIGSEMAASLAGRGISVTWVFPETGVMAGFYPPDLTQHVSRVFRGRGVELIPGRRVSQVKAHHGGYQVDLEGGESLQADLVVAGLGIEPQTELARESGLTIEDGIRVDAYLATEDPDVYAAGDVASYHLPWWPGFQRTEHEDNAVMQGKAAGANMAGAEKQYQHLPFFYSDLFDFRFEAIGDVRSELSMIEDWVTMGEEGVVYYLNDGRVVGVLNWGVWDGVKPARALITSREQVVPESLKGRIRNAEG